MRIKNPRISILVNEEYLIQTCYPTDNNYELWKNTETNKKELFENTMKSDQKQAEKKEFYP